MKKKNAKNSRLLRQNNIKIVLKNYDEQEWTQLKKINTIKNDELKN